LHALESRTKPMSAYPPAPAQMSRKGRVAMRPRKVILCVDSNEQALSVRKFMLETRGYRAVCVLHAQAALEQFEAGGVDLVLSELTIPGMDGNEMVRRMKQQAPEVPMMLVSRTVKDFARADAADAFLPKGANNALELLERIRMLMVRKRGPRPQGSRPEFSRALPSEPRDAANGAAHTVSGLL
jgi:two-component system response regulator CpxR